MGPSLADIHHAHKRDFTDPATGEAVEKTYDFVPVEVLGNVRYAAEPDWGSLPQMTYMEFYQGLRERNWTCKHFDPEADRWQVSTCTLAHVAGAVYFHGIQGHHSCLHPGICSDRSMTHCNTSKYT